ncbi:MAG: 2-hydroxy-3-oxopropionate reductase [Pseudomonadota bacterium]
MKIGYIGVGIMGAPMAGHLQAAGHDLYLVQNRSPLPEALLAAGATACGSAKEVAENSDVIFLNVPDTPDVEHVVFGPGGVAEGLQPDAVIVDNSTISPIATKDFAARIEALGGHFVDAPVSGGEVGAKAATLTIMVGATEDVFARVKPLLEIIGKTVTRIGQPGTGQICKACNQIIVALNIEAVAEALVFAAKAGADVEKVREALLGGFAQSRVLEIHGERMIKRTFEPGFRVELHHKDLGIALDSAKSLALSLPNTAAAQEMFNSLIAHGEAGLDDSALVKALERAANAKVAED